MHKSAKRLSSDTGYASELSSFGSMVLSSTPKIIEAETATATISQTVSQNAKAKINSFSHNKAARRYESFGNSIGTQKKSIINDVLLDCKTLALIALILTFAVLIISYKVILVAMPYTSGESWNDAFTYTQEKFTHMLDWANEKQLSTKLSPLICGIAVSMFAVMIVYFDSAKPGVCPALPFCKNQARSIDLNYLTALATGFVVSAIMWYEL